MSLGIININALQQEQMIQQSIYAAMNENIKIVFNAGAGSGKTYALIESLKYIISHFGSKLIQSNQKVICITYTNTAVQEIRERLGNTSLIIISTIHERLWDLIKGYKKELLQIHAENIASRITALTYTLNEDASKSEYGAYRFLNSDLKTSLKDYLLSIKETYYKNIDKPAASFKASFNSALDQYPNIIRNVSNFKKIVSLIYRIENYQYCLSKIAENHGNYRKVEYDSKYNNDILHKMLISHDTLIEYAHKMFNRYSLLRRVIVDKYPYILIDEYQDTNKLVIEIIRSLHQYSDKNKLSFFVGYFGDPAQNIYDDGIGNKLSELHPGLIEISKVFNRRSHNEIIGVINKIRGGNISQISVYDDADGGSVKFYSAQNRSEEIINSFIEKYKRNWNASSEKPLHCLVLTNKKVAEYNGFPDVFNHLSSTNYYSKNFQQAGTEILSHELVKLGQIPLVFYKILKFKNNIEDPKTTLSKILNEFIYKELSFADLKKLKIVLSKLNGNTIGEYIQSIFENYNDGNSTTLFRSIIKSIVKLHDYSYDSFYRIMFEKLFYDIDVENSEEITSAKKIMQSILDISIEHFIKWFHFINETMIADVQYHTYHGTKGREYENVVIIMENDFGNLNRNKFSSFLINISDPSKLTDEIELAKFNNTRNLIYVSCSRAIRNLRILYLDDTNTFRRNIIGMFGANYSYNGVV
jgi:DNA helicase II / ATP-dependent DNA helicase PcrA